MVNYSEMFDLQNSADQRNIMRIKNTNKCLVLCNVSVTSSVWRYWDKFIAWNKDTINKNEISTKLKKTNKKTRQKYKVSYYYMIIGTSRLHFPISESEIPIRDVCDFFAIPSTFPLSLKSLIRLLIFDLAALCIFPSPELLAVGRYVGEPPVCFWSQHNTS